MSYSPVATATSPRGEVILRERQDEDGTALELRVNGTFVMDTRETSTERALAEAALALVDHPADVLVGGLGLGFTAQAVLADERVGTCTVVELEPAVASWMRDGTIPHGPALVADERLRLVVDDLADAVRGAEPDSYDLVLLDVDNGPGYLVHETNAELYAVPFLAAAHATTRGVLVVWSAAESPELSTALERVFGNVDATSYPVRLGRRDERYWLYWARK